MILIARGLVQEELERDKLLHCSVLKVQTFTREERESGGNGIEDPPVPIPNTEVKLNCVDGTWRVTARESRTLPDYFFLKKKIKKNILA